MEAINAGMGTEITKKRGRRRSKESLGSKFQDKSKDDSKIIQDKLVTSKGESVGTLNVCS